MKFTCPSCKKTFEADRPKSGQVVKCPLCNYGFADTDPTLMDESRSEDAGNLMPGKEIAGFRIEQLIGRGSMGVVYKATQLSLNRVVALKMLPVAFADNTRFVERFHEESGALSTLNHPNIVTIHERGHVGKIYFFAMEYVDGPPLRDLMADATDEVTFLRVAKGTAAALSFAHERGVVHRDIKPANIVLNSRQEVKIADFGLAGLILNTQMGSVHQDKKSPRSSVMGTPAYMSPEQKKNSLTVDGRSDIYSAGVVFYELLTGTKPGRPVNRMPSEVSSAVDPRLDTIVTRCLAEDPGERYQSADQLLEDLEAFEAEWRAAPGCPACGKVNPVRFETCRYCGASLEKLFDICPECKAKIRHDVRRCLQCGADLERGRTLVTRKVTLMLDQADRLRLDGDYVEALQILEDVRAIEGRAFSAERERARVLRDKTVAERLKAAKTAYAEARRMLREKRFKKAIALLRDVPPDIKDTTKEIETCRKLQAQLAAQMRSQSTFNLILLALGLILVIVMAVIALRSI